MSENRMKLLDRLSIAVAARRSVSGLRTQLEGDGEITLTAVQTLELAIDDYLELLAELVGV